jgi:hypothetical protein
MYLTREAMGFGRLRPVKFAHFAHAQTSRAYQSPLA